MELTHPLIPMLRRSGILETLEVRTRQAVDARTSFVEFLTLLLQDALERRAFAPDTTREGVPVRVTLTRNTAQVFARVPCQCVARHETVLGDGPPVLFVSTTKRLPPLAGRRVDGPLAHRLARSRRPARLVLDDFPFGRTRLRPPGHPLPATPGAPVTGTPAQRPPDCPGVFQGASASAPPRVIGPRRTLHAHLPPDTVHCLRQTPVWCQTRAAVLGDRPLDRLPLFDGAAPAPRHARPWTTFFPDPEDRRSPWN